MPQKMKNAYIGQFLVPSKGCGRVGGSYEPRRISATGARTTYTRTAVKMVPETALPSSGSDTPPVNSSWPVRYRRARTLRITMAKTERTVLLELDVSRVMMGDEARDWRTKTRR